MKNISIKKACGQDELTLYISVKDAIIKENNACFRWKIGRDGSSIEELGKEAAAIHKLIELDIKDLSGYLFGYGDKYDAQLGACVEKAAPVYIDEVV